MPLFARRAFFGMTAIALSCVALSGCVPSNAAVGDTQSPDTAVAHSMEDRDSLSIAMIGSDDVTADSMAMGAMEAGVHYRLRHCGRAIHRAARRA